MTDSAALPTLDQLRPAAREIVLAYYQAGYTDGAAAAERSYEQMIEDLARRYVRMVHLNEELDRSLPVIAARAPYDVLAERRGDPERARRHRRLLRERGVSA